MRRLFLFLALLAGCNTPEWGKNALLHPARKASHGAPDGAEPLTADAGDGVTLDGWWARGRLPRRGLVLWLHGVGDNKDSARGIVERWVRRGFDVAAFDSRAHGASGGNFCSYGYYEKADVRRLLDALATAGAQADRAVLVGFSMGAAVAVQAAPLDARVRAVAALAPFARLSEVARRAAPFWMSAKSIDAAFALAESEGRFSVAEVAPLDAASRLHVPLLVVHGKRDGKVPTADGEAIFAAAPSKDKQLLLVDDTDHDQLLGRPETWAALDQFLDRVSPPDGRK